MSHFLHLHDSPSQVLDKVQVMLCLGGHAIDKKGKSAFLANLLSSDSQLVERLHGMGVFSAGSGTFLKMTNNIIQSQLLWVCARRVRSVCWLVFKMSQKYLQEYYFIDHPGVIQLKQ